MRTEKKKKSSNMLDKPIYKYKRSSSVPVTRFLKSQEN